MAELNAIFGDVVEQVIAAGTPNGLRGRVAGDPLCSLVPVGNHPVAVYKVDAVIKLVDDLSIEICFVGHCDPTVAKNIEKMKGESFLFP
jgi:hypothetical protein